MEGDRHLQIFRRQDGKVWKAVAKRTKDGPEIYLQSVHRTNAKQARRAAKKLKVVREQK